MRREPLPRRPVLASAVAAPEAAAPLAAEGRRAGQLETLPEALWRTAPERSLSVVCVGAHPDDPESGCGGTLIRYAQAGHRVTVLYLTRGERGIRGKLLDEAAAIRTAECRTACEILGARPVFAGQIDGESEASLKRAAELARLLEAEQPDIVFTQWPLDSHMDHLVVSALTIQAWRQAERKFDLYFYEVDAGEQTVGFAPTDYVDVTGVREKKRAALCAHKSQDGEQIYRRHHGPMEQFRGREIGVEAAEGFILFGPSGRKVRLP
ncbi:MAG TPA: PIG-L deacetylase family protein [Chthonomonadaceae bacterium]|nr:PIG-L deacetylase family protein [Chthonomonadaceae bacterium]